MTPETPLPWKDLSEIANIDVEACGDGANPDEVVTFRTQNYKFILHACNA